MSVPKPQRQVPPRATTKSQHRPTRRKPVVSAVAPANDNSVALAAMQSKRSKSGKKGEEIVLQYAAVAERNGVAWLAKRPTPTVWTPRGLRHLKAAGCDFFGCVLEGQKRGRLILAEAKVVSTKSFSTSRLEPEQRRELELAHEAGALALVILIYGSQKDVAVLPWHVVREVKTVARDVICDHIVSPEDFLVAESRAGHAAVQDGPGDARRCHECGVTPCLGRPVCDRDDFEPVSQAEFAAVIGKGVWAR